MQVVRTAADTAARPVSRALLPQWVARLLGLTALATVGALEWQRMIGGFSSGVALQWALAGLLAGVAVLCVDRVRGRWARAGALGAAIVVALLLGYVLSGADLSLLRPRNWGDLASGLAGGVQALGTVRLPYVSANPWPRVALEVLGAELLVLAGLLTFWPRESRAPEPPLAVPERGYPFLALAVLLVVVASPVVSLGGTRSLVLGLVIAALTVCFLWLERLPLRPGLGLAALLAVALAGALPLAAVADRGEPWFDYRSFAEGLGPDDPVQFSWAQSYGPMTWPRDGNEVMRVSAPEPLYWKARDLDVFDRFAWRVRRDPTPKLRDGDKPWEADVPEDWNNRPGWANQITVSIRRMRTTDVLGAGTIMDVTDESRPMRPGLASGTLDSAGPLRRGDSYNLDVYSPQPDGVLLAEAATGARERQPGETVLTVPFRPGLSAPRSVRVGLAQRRVHEAEVHFKPWDSEDNSFAAYPAANRSEYDVDRVMRRSVYARSWALAKRLRRGAKSAYDYILRVDRYLHQPQFHYSERPQQPPPGRAPLDFFLTDSFDGYCQHYAGAMALLLRMGGVPARVATGFSPGGYSQRRKAWIVRDTDAHAWVEAWFDRYGWVTFDPTPDATPARSQIAALAPPPSAVPTPASGESSGPGGPAGARGRQGLRADLLFDPQRNTTSGRTGAGGGRPWWPWALAAAALALLLAWLVAVRRGPRGGTPMDRAIAELERALRAMGRPVRTGTTLAQLERRLGGHSPDAAAYLRALAAGRYAAAPAPPPRTGRRALRRALAQGLGPAGRIRALWALPPRPR